MPSDPRDDVRRAYDEALVERLAVLLASEHRRRIAQSLPRPIDAQTTEATVEARTPSARDSAA